jgi:hypothetical protein
MKTDGRPQIDKHPINKWLEALRIQAETLEKLALKAAECGDSDARMDQERASR